MPFNVNQVHPEKDLRGAVIRILASNDSRATGSEMAHYGYVK